jgi:hypothetical protein
MLDRLRRWLTALVAFIKTAGAAHESDTDRDGFLSYSGETHGLAVGVYYGFIDFKDWRGLPDGYADGKNIETGWYPKAGYVVGASLRVACYLMVGGALVSLGVV